MPTEQQILCCNTWLPIILGGPVVECPDCHSTIVWIDQDATDDTPS